MSEILRIVRIVRTYFHIYLLHRSQLSEFPMHVEHLPTLDTTHYYYFYQLLLLLQATLLHTHFPLANAALQHWQTPKSRTYYLQDLYNKL